MKKLFLLIILSLLCLDTASGRGLSLSWPASCARFQRDGSTVKIVLAYGTSRIDPNLGGIPEFDILGNKWIPPQTKFDQLTIEQCREIAGTHYHKDIDEVYQRCFRREYSERFSREINGKHHLIPEDFIKNVAYCVNPTVVSPSSGLLYRGGIKNAQNNLIARAAAAVKPGETVDVRVCEDGPRHDGCSASIHIGLDNKITISRPTKQEENQGKKPQWCDKATGICEDIIWSSDENLSPNSWYWYRPDPISTFDWYRPDPPSRMACGAAVAATVAIFYAFKKMLGKKSNPTEPALPQFEIE
jgi:hypothetical protein